MGGVHEVNARKKVNLAIEVDYNNCYSIQLIKSGIKKFQMKNNHSILVGLYPGFLA